MEPPDTRSEPVRTSRAAGGRTPEARASRTGSIPIPEIFAREQERIFEGPGWLHVCLEAEIPKPGDFKRTRLGTKEVVVVRDASGEVNMIVNRCAHRSAQFCSASRGTAKDSSALPPMDLRSRRQAARRAVPPRLRARAACRPISGREEHGLQRLAVTAATASCSPVFVARHEPFEDYLGDTMLGYFDRVFDGRRLVVLGYLRQRIPSNWKLMFENIKDPYHASLLHVFLVTFGLFRLDQPSAVEMDATGRHGVLDLAAGASSRERGDPADAGVQARTSRCTIRACWTRCANSPATRPS